MADLYVKSLDMINPFVVASSPVSYTHLYWDDPIFHRRRVLHLPGDVYVIDDQVTGMGLSEHDIRLYFNFAFGELTEDGEGTFSYQSQKDVYKRQGHGGRLCVCGTELG